MSARDLRQRVAYMQGRSPIASPRGARASAVYDAANVTDAHALTGHPTPTHPPQRPAEPLVTFRLDLAPIIADLKRALADIAPFVMAAGLPIGRVHRHEKRNPAIYPARSVHRGVNPAAERRMATERNRARRRAARRARREGNRA